MAATECDKEEDWELVARAIHRGDIEGLGQLFDRGIPVDIFFYNEETPLIRAVYQKNIPLIRFLLERGANPLARDVNGRGVLTNISFSQDDRQSTKDSLEIVTILLEKGVSVDAPSWKETAVTLLMEACNSGSIEAVSFLLKNGANPALQDAYGKRALGWLSSVRPDSKKPVMTILLRLLAAGVSLDSSGYDSPDFLINMANTGDAEALLYLLNQPVFSALFAKGTENDLPDLLLSSLIAPLHGSPSNMRAVFSRLEALGAHLSYGIDEGESYLFKTKDPQVVIALLDQGLPINATDAFGRNLILDAVNRYTNDFHTPSYIRALARRGVSVNQGDNHGERPLMCAKSVELANLLLELGADIRAHDQLGKTVLHYKAVSIADKDLLKIFLKTGSDIDARDNDGMTPLLTAAYYGETDVVYLLANQGASVLARDAKGYSALDHSVVWITQYYLGSDTAFRDGNSGPFVSFLLTKGVSADTPGIDGESALLRIVRKDPKCLNVVTKILVSRVSKQHIADSYKLLKAENTAAILLNISSNFKYLALSIGLLILMCGLSIWMREGVFVGRPAANWMVAVNSVFTMVVFFAVGLGFILGYAMYEISGGSRATGMQRYEACLLALIGGSFGAIVGVISGFVVGSVPRVRSAFSECYVLYYLPSVLSFAVLISVVKSIFF